MPVLREVKKVNLVSDLRQLSEATVTMIYFHVIALFLLFFCKHTKDPQETHDTGVFSHVLKSTKIKCIYSNMYSNI